MNSRQQSMPLFGEVMQRAPSLQKSREFVFFAPHTSEHPSVIPLISTLSERMGKGGIATESMVIEEMRESVIAISSRLSRIWGAGKERDTLEKLFGLKDAVVRVEAVARMLASRPESALVEVQTLDRDYDDMDRFEPGNGFYRIPNTRVLYARDYAGAYETQVAQGIEAAESRGKAATALKGMLALDIARLKHEVPAKIEMLRQNAGRTMLMEMPAPVGALPDESHPTTSFEATYGYRISLKHTLASHEIDSVFAALVRR